MKIAFVTTQNFAGSTMVGRVLPLAQELSHGHEVHVLVHRSPDTIAHDLNIHVVGKDPFERSETGKKRLGGIRLIAQLKLNALRTFFTLLKLQPDVVIIVKPLPQNVFAVWLTQGFNRKAKIILDVDDFELTANKLSSIFQRAAVHWAERAGARLANQIVAASPFLQDHFEQLTGGSKRVTLIPTGISKEFLPPSRKESEESTKNSLLYIGSVSISSGHRVDLLPDILEAVQKEQSEVTLTVAGSGDDVAALKAKFRDKGLEKAVIWTGRFTSPDIPQLLSGNPILLDPVDASISNRAKSSFRVMLAALAGLPVVTSNIGIRPLLMPHVLHDRLFAEPESVESYTDRILTLLVHPLHDSERRLLHEHALQYTWERLSQIYARIITA